MKTKNYHYQAIKDFIRDFNFPDPNWENLPDGFFFIDKKGFNKEEINLHSAILAAWLIDRSGELRQQILQKSHQNPLISNLYLAGKIAIVLLLAILITGNLLNYFLIEVYHSIL